MLLILNHESSNASQRASTVYSTGSRSDYPRDGLKKLLKIQAHALRSPANAPFVVFFFNRKVVIKERTLTVEKFYTAVEYFTKCQCTFNIFVRQW